MVTVQSLGLREPSALSYLIAESIIPPEPLRSSYVWKQQLWSENNVVTAHEVLIAHNTVIWSQNGTIRRVYDLQIEGEPLRHAFVTHFVNAYRSNVEDGIGLQANGEETPESALVVILRTQAHIYLLSGDTHVLPLPFETRTAFALPRGFVLQRQDSESDSEDNRHEVKESHNQSFLNTKSKLVRLPRTYSYTEILSDIGLVVVSPTRRPFDLNECKLLPTEEQILYISASNELENEQNSQKEPLYIAVTIDRKTLFMTVWQVVYSETDEDPKYGLESKKAKKTARRKSSGVYINQTGIATPLSRGLATFRESFGALAQSMTDNIALENSKDQISHQGNDLAAQLGHEFEHTGVQTRSARRVSSMLARTDLGGTTDRSAFNDLPLGPSGRKSLGLSVRRGESLGGFSDRQSFGRRRSSFQANSSVMSESTSFLDIPAGHLLEDGYNIQPEVNDRESYDDRMHPHPRDVGFLKMKSFPFKSSLKNPIVHEDFQIITILAPDRSTADERRSRILSVCILHHPTCAMTTVNLAVKPQLSASRSASVLLGNEIKATDVHYNHTVVDICKVRDDAHQRLLTLTRTRNNQGMLHLEAPWSAPFRLDLPTSYKVFESWTSALTDASPKRRDTGIRRVITGSEINPVMFGAPDGEKEALVLDDCDRSHSLRIKLMPSNPTIRKVLKLANLIFGPEQMDSLLVAWWEVKRWLETQSYSTNLEWTAMTVAIFLLAVPFISKTSTTPKSGHRRNKSGILRSSSGAIGDLKSWAQMSQITNTNPRTASRGGGVWDWIQTPAAGSGDESKKDDFLLRCSSLAREFLQSPAGEQSMGPEGYLPTAVNKERDLRRTALARMLIGLHLLREEQKLDIIAAKQPAQSTNDLALIICQLAVWLKWPHWTGSRGKYYATEIQDYEHWLYDSSVIDSLETPKQRFEPPSIFQHIEDIIVSGSSEPFISLLDLISSSRQISSTHPLFKTAISLTPRMFSLISFFGTLKKDDTSRTFIELMLKNNVDRDVMKSIPEGIAAIFHKTIDTMRVKPVSSWSHQAYDLLDRPDLEKESKTNNLRRSAIAMHSHEALRDYRAISIAAIDPDVVSKWDASSEIDRQTVTKLIFQDDRRFQEASKLVNQTRPPVVECIVEAEWTESDLLEAQKELAQHVSRRTFSVSAGRGMMHFNARVPLLTERVPIPAFTPQCVIKPSGASDHAQTMTFSADKSLFTEEKTCWAFFHNGASAGLMISKTAKWIDTSWILYNKPSELTNRHAGFLLALGLNGHLVSLAKWVAFKYLTPKHTMTSVGLLLGLSASYLGTTDTLITRLLSVHVTRLLPPGAAELNLSPLTQTAGLMGIGLLYHNSQHRRMSEVMLSEIENSDSEERPGDEPILRDEGYRLAAGFSLGLINLGHGGKLHSLHDMNLVERLLTIAIGPKNVNFVHVLDRATAGSVIAIAFIYMKTNNAALAQKVDIPDTLQQFEYVRPDIFLLRTLARHLIMWDSIQPSKDFIRVSLPPSYQSRAELSTTKRLSTDDLPFFNIIAGLCFAISLRFAGSHRPDVRDLLILYLDQFWRISKLPALNYDSKITLNSVRNCLDVLALSCATVMAGSGDLIVMRRLRALHGRTDPETPFGSHLAAHMALGALFLSGGTATFATSNLAIASLVIAFYPVFPTDILDNRGHLQALRHLWVLAVDDRCLIGRDIDTGQVIGGIEAQLTLTNGSKTNIWTPNLLPDLDTVSRIQFSHDSYWPVDLILSSVSPDGEQSDNEAKDATKSTSKKRTLRDDLKADPKKLSIPLLRRPVHEVSRNATSAFTAELQALDEARGIPSLDANATVNERWKHTHAPAHDPFDWVFRLHAFKETDHAEKALVLENGGANLASSISAGGSGKKALDGTVVDTRLEFEMGILGLDETTSHEPSGSQSPPGKTVLLSKMHKDRLWQLRLLLAWSDKWEQEAALDSGKGNAADAADQDVTDTSQNSQWLRQEVVDRLRWRIWKMAGGD